MKITNFNPVDNYRLCGGWSRSQFNPVQRGGRVAGPSRAGPKQAAEKLGAEGGGGFNPRIRPTESARALAPEGRNLPISRQTQSFSAACKTGRPI
jgi:hypothetical protein